MKYKIWDGQETLVTPIGEVLTPEAVRAKYPVATIPGMKFIIADSPIQLQVWDEFTGIKEMYKKLGAGITDEMTDQEVLDAVSAFQETPVEAEPTAEERIAAALEFQSLMML